MANQLQLNGTGAIIDLNARLLTVLNQNSNAIFTTNIAGFGTARHIRSERTDNQSRVRWDIAGNLGAHLVPFGTTTNYMPFTFNLLSGNAGSVTMATYGTPPDNLPWPTTPTLVTSLGSQYNLLLPDNRDATVDRFWQVDVTGTPTAQLTFTYAPSELPVAPYDDPFSLLAQRWNVSGQLWETQLAGSAAAYYGIADAVSAFGPFTSSNILSPLPIELLHFTARPVQNRVRLDWATASERENDYFTVLRSRDGIRYEEVAQVDGAGNSSSAIGYEAYDPSPYSGVSFYKLRQTDSDGARKESDAVQVRFEGDLGTTYVFPNPAVSVLHVAGMGEDEAELTLTDATGRVIGRYRKAADTDRTELPVADLPAGIYTLSIATDAGREALRFVRQ
ncbi:MAG: T9SS type A sorting domain-containing protein [Flavobacteriales bacterium]|nr:T9SS type A sorting domain-containing protein [Flavobacteriales bacterium]